MAVGQTLYVTEGIGLVQSRGGPVEEGGEVITTPPDEWHWHGAAPAPDHSMTTCPSRSPRPDRAEADWGDHVTDEEYAAPPAADS